jgi:hypothetical protein
MPVLFCLPELVLCCGSVCRLKPIIFMPGDYVCRKGDVGMEMFIVSSGAVQVRHKRDVNVGCSSSLVELFRYGTREILAWGAHRL